MRACAIILIFLLAITIGCQKKNFAKIKLISGELSDRKTTALFKPMKKRRFSQFGISSRYNYKNYLFAELEGLSLAINPRLTSYQGGIVLLYSHKSIDTTPKLSVRGSSIKHLVDGQSMQDIEVLDSATGMTNSIIKLDSGRLSKKGFIQTTYRDFKIERGSPVRILFEFDIEGFSYQVDITYIEQTDTRYEPIIGAPASP